MDSLDSIRQSANKTLCRFPLVLLTAAIATGIGISWLFHPWSDSFTGFFLISGRFLLVSLLGIPWLYSLTLFAERFRQGSAKRWIPWLGVAVMALYYLRLTRLPTLESPEAFFFEVVAIWFGLHFLAAYAPFIGGEEARGFWEYNRAIFLRFLLALLFSATLCLGIGIFFSLLSAIFKMDFIKVYSVTALFVLGIFNTWFFLAGVPSDWAALEQEPRPYPRALKFFAQFVLVPLVVLIGLGMEILFVKELVGAQKSALEVASGFLVLGAFGLLTFLLLHPLAEGRKPSWLQVYRRGLAIVMLPPLLWLTHSTMGEIRSQGVTQEHYFLLLLSAWGIGMALYLLVMRSPKIKWIPMSLSLLAFFSAMPPLGAASFTRRSQGDRLAALFDQSGLQKGAPDLNKLVALPEETRAKLSEKTELLRKNFGCEALKPFFGDLVQSSEQDGVDCRSQRLRVALNLDSGPKSLQQAEIPPLHLNFNRRSKSSYEAIRVEGFAYYFPESGIEWVEKAQGGAACSQETQGPTLCASLDKENQTLELFLNRQALGPIDLKPTLEKLVAKHAVDLPPQQPKDAAPDHYYDLSEQDLSFDFLLSGKRLRLAFSSLFLEKRGEQLNANALQFSALLQ